MKNKILLAITLIATLLITVACSAANAQTTVKPTVNTQEISFGSADAFTQNPHPQKQIEVAVGDQILIALPSNATTGFSWDENAAIADSGILEQLKHEDIAASSELMGAAGAEQYTFKALKAGMTTVHLDYSRPWEGGEKGVWTLDLTVRVK